VNRENNDAATTYKLLEIRAYIHNGRELRQSELTEQCFVTNPRHQRNKMIDKRETTVNSTAYAECTIKYATSA